MLPRIAEPTDSSDRRDSLSDRCGAFRAALIVCLSAMLAACAFGPAHDQVTASDLREHMTLDDRHIAELAVQIAMERRGDNEASTWTNGLSGNHGAVVPRRTYRSRSGSYCRSFEETMTVAGVTATYQRTACRGGDGNWTALT